MASLKLYFVGLLVLLGLSLSVGNRVILDSTTDNHQKFMKDHNGQIGLKWNGDEGGHEGYGVGIGIGKGGGEGYGVGIGKGKGHGYGVGIGEGGGGGGGGKPCHGQDGGGGGGGGGVIYVPVISCASCPPECMGTGGKRHA